MQSTVPIAVRRGGYRIANGVEIYPGGAAHIVDENALVVADMHLGVEASLESEGLSVPRVQTKKILQYMDQIIERVRPETVVVAGDLKHNFNRNLIEEWQEVTKFVEQLAGRTELECIKGNHDNFLNLILREHGVPPVKKELIYEDVQIVHGHVAVERRGLTIIGHIHPSLRLRDSVGASIKDHCYLWDPVKRILVLPALSLLASGVDVVSGEDADTISPYFAEGGLSGCYPILFSKDEPLKFPSVGELRQSA